MKSFVTFERRGQQKPRPAEHPLRSHQDRQDLISPLSRSRIGGIANANPTAEEITEGWI